MNQRSSSGPLGDLRVLELADEKGQWCGKLMGDMGADVIKIEPPGGVAERNVGPFYQDVPHPERSLYFWHYNTSKRSITLDLETEDGRNLLLRLVSSADVLLETFPPGYLPSLGLGYQQLREVNPRLVMCSLTPFGQTGPWRDFQTSDLVHLAAGGQMASSGYNEEDVPDAPPIAPGGGNAWHMGSHYAYIAIMAAVCFRDFTGRGNYIDASVHGACALTTEGAMTTYFFTKQVMRRNTGRHHSVRPSGRTQYRCKDGKYINSGGVGRLSPERLKAYATWLDTYGLAQDLLDPKFQDPAVIAQSGPHIEEVLVNFFANTPSEEAYRGAQDNGFLTAAVRAPEDTIADLHWHDRGFFVDVEHPELNTSFTYPGAAAIMSRSPWQISRRAPLIGEHNQEIFGEELGLSQGEMNLLREIGAI